MAHVRSGVCKHEHDRATSLGRLVATSARYAPSTEGVAGFLASATNIILTYPAFKTVFRAQAEGTTVSRQMAQLAKEGVGKLWVGVTPPLLQRSLQVSVMFGANETLRRRASEATGLASTSPSVALFAATGSGLLESTLAPFERVQSILASKSGTFGVAAGGPRAAPAPNTGTMPSLGNIMPSMDLAGSQGRGGRARTRTRTRAWAAAPMMARASHVCSVAAGTGTGAGAAVRAGSCYRGTSSTAASPAPAGRLALWGAGRGWRRPHHHGVGPPRKGGTLAVAAWLLRSKGGLELYRGWQIIASRNVLSNALFFGLRDRARGAVSRGAPWAPGWACDFAGGGLLGASISTALLPLATAKAWVQAQVPVRAGAPLPFLSPAGAIRALVQRRGLRGLYRGAALNFGRSAAGWGIMNSAYEAFKGQLAVK